MPNTPNARRKSWAEVYFTFSGSFGFTYTRTPAAFPIFETIFDT